jgi:hypothetical protein
MALSALCKICLYYNPGDKTCGRSIVAVDKGKVHHNYAKFVRLDKNQCGPQGKWFEEISKKTAIDELFESFDI